MSIIKKNFIFIFIFIFLSNCQGLSDFKKVMRGEKVNTTDEFLIKKKDPLILPPDYENLPSPDERKMASEEITVFEKKLGESIEEASDSSSTTEESILKEIKKR